jgi:hypothetical protein
MPQAEVKGKETHCCEGRGGREIGEAEVQQEEIHCSEGRGGRRVSHAGEEEKGGGRGGEH